MPGSRCCCQKIGERSLTQSEIEQCQLVENPILIHWERLEKVRLNHLNLESIRLQGSIYQNEKARELQKKNSMDQNKAVKTQGGNTKSKNVKEEEKWEKEGYKTSKHRMNFNTYLPFKTFTLKCPCGSLFQYPVQHKKPLIGIPPANIRYWRKRYKRKPTRAYKLKKH